MSFFKNAYRYLKGPQRGETMSAIRFTNYARIPNIGDVGAADMISHITNKPIIRVAEYSQPYLVTIGSILDIQSSTARIWGSGLMDPVDALPKIQASSIYAVRGKNTFQNLKKLGLNLPDIPLGDPGFLMPLVFPVLNSQKKFKLGIVAHYVDTRHPFFVKLRQEQDVLDISVHTSPEIFFEQLNSCEVIVSSSLHGLIFAESYNIPNLWVGLSTIVQRTGFKFADWYSTTAHPQKQPYIPNMRESVDDLSKLAQLHDSQINTKDLLDAFPLTKLDELSTDVPPAAYKALVQCRQAPMPVFVISFNRADFLRQCVDTYRTLQRPVDIVIHDNGSDDVATLQLLQTLEKQGCKVVFSDKIHHADDLNRVNVTVQDYFKNWAYPSHYVVTDCDIDLSIADKNVLDVYAHLLNVYRFAECVGPMLRIRDVPTDYPLRRSVMARHIEQFWQHKPEWLETSFGSIASIEAVIDTTFAMHRAGEPFKRLKRGRRVYQPYEAKHLDWYLSPEQYYSREYFRSSAPDVAHWNNQVKQQLFADDKIAHTQFTYVDLDQYGQLTEFISQT